jgi:PAS domain S-box-containing protein
VTLLGSVFTTFYAFNFNLLAVFSSIFIILAGVVAYAHGYRHSRYFLVAWPGFFLPFGMARLVRLGILPTDFILPDLHFGIIWLGFFWTLALADQINILKARTEAANKEIAQKERDLQQYLEAMPVGVAIYDTNGMLKYINQHARQLLSNPARGIQLDVTSERTIDQIAELLKPRIAGTDTTYPLDKLPLRQALLGKNSHADDIEADLIDMRVPLEAWASPVFSEDGDVQFAIAIFQDITLRKRFEESLRESQSRLSGILDLAADAIISFDENQEVTLFNQAAEDTFGYRSQDVIGKTLDILIPERFIAAHRAHIHDFDRSEDANLFMSESQPFYYMRKNGEEFPVDGSISKLELQDGKIFTIILRDISRRLQMDAELKQHREHLEELVKSRTEELVKINEQLHDDHAIRIEQAKQLAAIEERNRLARDLHDSVTQILFSASLVAEVLPQKWQRDPNEGRRSLNELLLLTRGALAEMRTLLLELRPEAITRIPLGELIAQLTEAVTSRGYLPFELYIEKVPPVPDDVQIAFYRVAQEALNNAVKHANAKRVSVNLNFSQVQDPGSKSNGRRQVKLSIQDDGVGFNTGALREEKMGLGIMRERAKNIGAALEIASQRGEGTRVTLNWQS